MQAQSDEVQIFQTESRRAKKGVHWRELRGPGKFGTGTYVRLRSDGSIRKTIARFAVRHENGCVLWTSKHLHKTGYGVIVVGYDTTKAFKGKPNGVLRLAHCVVWELENGPVPEGLELDHFTCRTRNCVALEHLRPVAHRENMRNSVVAIRPTCAAGHELNDHNVVVRTERGTARKRCRECERRRGREYARKRTGWPKPKSAWTHCLRGHEYTEENTRTRHRPDGRECRVCVECQRMHMRNHRARLTAQQVSP